MREIHESVGLITQHLRWNGWSEIITIIGQRY
jgi:hypothetical protein